MRFLVFAIGLVLIVLVLSACGAVTGGDKIDELETKNAQYQATIDALGTPVLTIIALEQYATQNVVLQARLSQAETESLAARATLTVYELGGGVAAAQPTPPAPNVAVDPNNAALPGLTPTPGDLAAAGTPEAATDLTQFSQTVTATDLDSNDCPLGITTAFEPAVSTIYVNTRINYLPSGSQLGARWTANGELFFDDVNCWSPTQDYFDICAYCSIVPDSSGTFTAGSWLVELTLDGQTMAQVDFQVGDAAQPESADATPEGGDSTSWKGN